jgi:putative addiction module component (TIGR02574 family)
MTTDLQAVFALPAKEKLELVQDLWDDLAANPDNVPLHQWQIDEVERRAARLAANPELAVRWEDVKRRIRARYGR